MAIRGRTYRPRMTTAAKIAVAAVGVAALFTVTACSSGSSSTSGSPAVSGGSAKTLVLLANQDPGNLDYVTNDLTAVLEWIPGNVVEPLLDVAANGTATPSVADKWSVSPNGETYTFHIGDSKFSNGKTVTPADVVYSLQTMQKSALYSSYYSAVTSISTGSGNTVVVQLSRPSRNFFQGLGYIPGLIQPAGDASTLDTDPIGTGPYEVASYVPNSKIVFKANPYYTGPKPAIPNIQVNIVTVANSDINALETGSADGMLNFGASDAELAQSADLEKSFSSPQWWTSSAASVYYVLINSKLPLALRQAIAEAIDGKALIESQGSTSGLQPTCSFAVESEPYYAAESAQPCPYPYDPAKAAAAIKAGGFEGKTINFMAFDAYSENDLIVADLQAAGLTVKNTELTLAQWSQVSSDKSYDVSFINSTDSQAGLICPDAADEGWTTFCDPAYNAAMAKADAATSTSEYDSDMLQAQDILRDDAVILPVAMRADVSLWSKDLTGDPTPVVGLAPNLAALSWR